MAESITVELNVRDRGTSVVKKFGDSMRQTFGRMGSNALAPTNKLSAGLGGLTKHMRTASTHTTGFGKSVSGSLVPMRALGALLAGFGLFKLIKDTVSVSQNMEALQLAMNAAAGGAKQGAAEFSFVRAESERLGLEIGSTAGAYKGLLAATIASNKTAAEARTIFTGVAEASRAMGLSNEQTKGTLLAVQQIMSKGKVSAEEMTQQLGERFPVAMGVLSQATGKSIPVLLKLMETGKLTSDVMVSFGQKLTELYGQQATEAAEKSGAAFNRLGNTMTELKTRIGEGGLLDAVTMVANGLREMFKEMLKTDVPEQLGQAFKLLGTALSDIVKKFGPGVVKVITNLSESLAFNLQPVLLTLGKTSSQVWAVMGAALEQSIALVAKATGAAATAIAWLSDQSRKLKVLVLNEEDVKYLAQTAVEARNLASDMAALGASSTVARDKWLDMLVKVNNGTVDATENTKLTAKEVRDLGDGAVVTGGKVVDAGKKMTEAIKAPGDAAKKTKEAVDDLADAYGVLKQKTQTELVEAANKSVAAFETIMRSGTETKERLADLFRPVASEIIASFGRVPIEMQGIFSEMRLRTGENFSGVTEQGKTTANSLKSDFKAAGEGIGSAIEAGARRGEAALTGLAAKMQQRTQEINDQLNATQNAFDNFSVTSTIPSTIEGLQKYIQDRQREMASVTDNVNSVGFADATRQHLREVIEQADRKLKEMLLAQNDLQGRYDTAFAGGAGSSSSRPSGGGSSSSSLENAVVRPPSHASNAGSGLESFSAPSEGSKVLSDSDAITMGQEYGGDAIFQRPPLPPGFSGGQVSQGTIGGNVIIEGAQFIVNQSGIDPSAIDARGLVRAILPALREEARRGELSLSGA